MPQVLEEPRTEVRPLERGGRDGGGTLLAATVDALAGTLGLRDGGTGAHCSEVVELASAIGRRIGLRPRALRDLAYAAELHDIGKVGIPDAVLHKAGPLAGLEWELVRRHADAGADLLGQIPGLERAARIVRHHHERYDGGGYPHGLAGEAIPIESRVLTAADAYIAMTEDRPYRRALSATRVSRELQRERGRQFDPAVVDALEAEVAQPEALAC